MEVINSIFRTIFNFVMAHLNKTQQEMGRLLGPGKSGFGKYERMEAGFREQSDFRASSHHIPFSSKRYRAFGAPQLCAL